MNAMSASSTSVALTSATWKVIARVNSSTPTSAEPIPKQAAAIRSVTAGPAAAILKSIHGVGESRFIRARPPNIHRSIPTIPTPLRIATIACPSSWSRMERKNSSAAATASPKARSSWPGNWSPYCRDWSRMTRKRKTNQLVSAPMRMPATRAIWIERPPSTCPWWHSARVPPAR
jgi:hypothetical protein